MRAVRLAIDRDGGWIGPVDAADPEDEVRTRLEWMREDAAGLLSNGSTVPRDAARGLTYSRDLIEHIPELIGAAEAGDLWRAVLLALRVGHTDGRWTQHRPQIRAERTVRKARGERVSGGEATRLAPPDEELAAAVLARRTRMPNDGWSAVCTWVGKQYPKPDGEPLSRQTVAERAKAAGVIPWPHPARKKLSDASD